MTLEEINEWLDNEYGVSYTKLEELHDFYFEKYCDLEKENQELKKQLEEYDRKLFITKNELDMRQKSIDNKLNQQKEFIEYLENEINKFKELEKFAREVFDNNKIINIGLAQKTIEENNLLISNFNIILSKYKEIIGDDK